MCLKPYSRVIIGVSITLLSFILAACASTPQPTATSIPPTIGPTVTPSVTPVPMAVLINDEGITREEFESELQRYFDAQAALGRSTTSEEAASRVLDELITQVLLVQGAREEGFVVDDALLQSRLDALAAQIGGQDALTAWQEEHSYTPEIFREALRRSIAAAWMRDRIAASVAESTEQVHVQQILLYNEDAARKVLADLAGGIDFDTLAARNDPLTRGDLGWFPRGYLLDAQIEQTAFALQPGQTSDIIKSDIGYHIIKVLARDPRRQLSPDAYLTMQVKAVADWIEQQRQKSKIILAP